MQKKSFTELGLSAETLKAVEKMGYEEASPIQTEAIPVLLQGSDVVGQSQTGSGKTAAFAIPAVERVDPAVRAAQVLILCPTRELAAQVAEEVAKLAAFKKGVRELPIYGGGSYDRQIRGLESGAQIIIGTPGRVMDHLERGTLKLGDIRMVILDEADRMLDMGFRDDIETILSQAPAERQTVLFSATLPRGIKELVEHHTRDAVRIKIESQALTVPAIEQIYYEVDRRGKLEALCRIIDVDDVGLAIIFCSTKMMCDTLAEHLTARGYLADKLHGDMTQAMRERVMKRFRERKVEFLVATDVAARGLDIDDIEVVFNYDLPQDAEDYLHRIGRTGRAGRSGRAITFVAGRDIRKLEDMISLTGSRIRRERVPSLEQVEEKRINTTLELIKETLAADDFPKREEIVDRLLDRGYPPTTICSALLHLLMTAESRRTGQPSDEPMPEERPGHDFHRGRHFDDANGPGSRRPRRGDRANPSDQSTEPGMTRIVITAGRNDDVRPSFFVGKIIGLTGAGREAVGAIFIQPKHTLVDVANDIVQDVIRALNGKKIGDRRISAFIPGGEPPTRPRKPFKKRY
ncbi:MAG: DEAD/DEAH box helicase [Terrimicrobiaceae bacterium]